jgi:cyclopropane-fatty-acyl-phospholipid synthase
LPLNLSLSRSDPIFPLAQAFLSSEMMYSCALWGPTEGGVRGDLEPSLPPSPSSPTSSTGTLVSESAASVDDGALEAAQARKIAHVLAALRLRPGMRVLEFGSGWGALAITAAREYGVEIDSLTLSAEQKRLADERICAAGVEGRVRVHLMDYREIPCAWDGCFDAFVSIEMLEVSFFAGMRIPAATLMYFQCSMSAPRTTTRTSPSSTGPSNLPMRRLS